MEKAFKENGEDKSKALYHIKVEIEKNRDRINNAQQMMLDGQLDASDYKDVKKRYEPEIDRLVRKSMAIASMDSNYKKYLEKGFGLIKQLAYDYNRADLATKQQLIGSVFPEKLIFENKQYRTNGMMKVILRICKNINAFGAKKSGTETSDAFQSHGVIPLGLEPGLQSSHYTTTIQ